MTNRLTDAELEAIQARVDAATPGPWFEYLTMDSGRWTVQIARGWMFVASDKGTGEDAAFVAHARVDVPRLLSDLAAARKVVEAARAMLKAHPDSVEGLGLALALACAFDDVASALAAYDGPPPDGKEREG